MPGAYRYSATFDRTYEEDPPPTLNEQSQGRNQHSPTRRSLSSNGIHHRSASTDSLDSMFGSSGSSTGHSRQVSFENAEHIPTRMVKKVTAKPAHNPLQFVKVSSCPLSRKAEEIAKKKPEHKEKIKDEEEEWQSNLDNWKSRRRKQSEGALLRLEEIRRIEMEEQQRQQEQKKTKTKTFSEMMEERAQRPKQYNLHIYSRRASESVLRLEHDFGNCSFSKVDNDNSSCDKESSDSTLCDSTVEEMMDNERQDSSDKGLSESRSESKGAELAHRRHSTGGNNQISYNRIEKHLSEINENELEKELAKEKLLSSGGYTNTDSGLDSLSSSHKTGDIADSASDFSQDSGSSLDSDFHHTTGSLTTGVELLEEFSSRVQSFSENVMPNYEQKGGNGLELFLRIWLKQGSENKDFGFVLKGGSDQNVPVVDSVIPGGVGDQAGLRKNDQILAINGECTQDIKQEALSFVVQQASYTGHLDLVIWRAFNNSDCNAQENSLDTLKQICSEDIHPKQSSESVEKQNSLVSHRKSSFEGEPKQKSVIQRTNKDIKPAINFKEKVSSFERRSSADECSTLVSKQVSSKLRPPVPAKPPQLQSNCESDSTSPNSKCTDNKLSSCEEKLNIVDTSEKKTNKNKTDVSKCETDSNKVLPKVTSKDSECDSKTLYIENAQQSAKDASSNSEHSVNQLTKSNFNSKPNQLPLQNCENEEKYQPQRLIDLQPICNESGLNIIYDSHPEQNTQEANRVQSNLSSPEIEVKSKSKLVSQTCTKKTDAGKIDSKKSSCDKIETNSVAHNKSSNELKEERHTADELKQQNQSQEDVIKQQYDLNTDLYNIPLNLSQDDILLADLDNSHRKIEPPKEKPPPPPPDESDVESSEKPPVIRANSTKEIKRELWKRRSDFLGIEFENGPIEVDESQLPCPLAMEDILKSERELEREKRQLLEQQTMLRLRRIAEEEEIARKEREIIENIEREERERQQQAERERQQQQALEMEAALIHEREHPVSANEMSHSGNKKDIEINGIQQPKKKKTNEKILEIQKPCLQQSNSVNRIKNELPAQGKERYIRHQQDADSSKVSKQQPTQGDNEIKQSKTNSETQASQNNSSVKSENKAINNSSSNKTPTKKMIMRQERERLRREQEDLQKQDSHVLQKRQKAMQASKQCKPNGVHQDIVPNRIANDQSSFAQMSSNPWDREDIIYASRHPEAAPAESKFENNVETESGNQELPLHSKPLSKHNLHSLGAAPKAKVLTNEQWMKPNEKVAKRRTETAAESGYNQYHWLVQEAEIRRIAEQKERQYQHSNEHRSAALPPPPSTLHPNNSGNISNGIHKNQYQIPAKHPPTHCALPFGHPFGYDVPRRNSAPGKSNNGHSVDKTGSPTKPPRSSSREQLLSVSGRKRCSHCGNELGRGAAMIIESLQLFYHIQCFCCCVCQAQLGNGSCGTDVRVRNNKLHCQHCYSNDEAGLKFSQV